MSLPRYLYSWARNRATVFAVLLLLTWFVLPGWASTWVERRNQEPDSARPLGWSFEVPDDWRSHSLANFPYPLGESWSGSEGSFQVCWLGQSAALGGEQFNLEERGYQRSEVRLAGRDASQFQRQQDVFCYIKTPQGCCRLHITGSNPLQQRIIKSFTLLQVASAAPSTSQKFAEFTFQLPSGWKWKEPDLLTIGDDPVCRLTRHDLSREQMPRGWARTQATQDHPELKERLGMEPFASQKGLDGYLVEWKGPAGSLLFGYAAREQKGVRFQLLKPSELERLRRLLSTLQFTP